MTASSLVTIDPADVEELPSSVAVTLVSWTPTGPMSFEEWQHAGRSLQDVARSIHFLLGDWLAFGEQAYGETYVQAVDDTGLEQQTILNIASVARRVPVVNRRPELSWSHHAEVASLEPTEQVRWLDEALVEGLSVKRLRSRLRGVPADAPDPEGQLAPTHISRLTFKHVAESDEDAYVQAKRLAAVLERHGCRVVHKKTDAL